MNEIADHARTEERPPQLPRRKFFNDMPDRGLFGIAALAGFACVFLFKRIGYNAELIAAAAVGIMLTYGVVAFRMPAVSLHPDRLGDNFYYLGFIYTLASLSAALLQLNAQVATEQLIGSFGIALITTIVGIAGRVMFVQLRGNLDTIEEQARRDLAVTASELRAQLGAAVREFETFRTGLLQSLTETSEVFVRAGKYQADQIDEMARKTAKSIDAAFAGNRSQVEQLQSSMRAILESVELVSKRASTMEFPNDALSGQMSTFAKELEAHLERLGGVIDEIAARSAQRRRWYWPFGRR